MGISYADTYRYRKGLTSHTWACVCVCVCMYWYVSTQKKTKAKHKQTIKIDNKLLMNRHSYVYTHVYLYVATRNICASYAFFFFIFVVIFKGKHTWNKYRHKMNRYGHTCVSYFWEGVNVMPPPPSLFCCRAHGIFIIYVEWRRDVFVCKKKKIERRNDSIRGIYHRRRRKDCSHMLPLFDSIFGFKTVHLVCKIAFIMIFFVCVRRGNLLNHFWGSGQEEIFEEISNLGRTQKELLRVSNYLWSYS